MFIGLGIVAGLLGFAPVFLSMRLARRSSATDPMSLGLFGLAGMFASLIVLVVALIVVAVTSRPNVVAFAVPEMIAFLATTIAYVLYNNVFAKKRKRVE